MKLSIGLKEAWKLDLQSISWALHEYTLSLKCSRWDPKMRYVYRHKDRRWQLLTSQTWRYNSPKLVFESPVLCSQCNLMLHIVLIQLGKSISLSDKPVNPLNSCEIHIALSFSCFIMYVTVPAHLDEQLAHFRCVHGKILNVLLKLHLSNSTLSRYEVQPGEQQLSKTSKPNKLSPFFFTTKTQMLKCIHIYIKYLSHTWMPQFAAHISSVQHIWFLSLPLWNWQPGKPWHTNTAPFPLQQLHSCCICAICSMVFLIPMESASDLSLQRQGTALTPHRCAHNGGRKGVWELTGEDGGRTGAGSTLTFCPLWHLAHSHQSKVGPTLHRPPSTARTMSCVTAMPKRKHCGMGWAIPAVFLKGMHWS